MKPKAQAVVALRSMSGASALGGRARSEASTTMQVTAVFYLVASVLTSWAIYIASGPKAPRLVPATTTRGWPLCTPEAGRWYRQWAIRRQLPGNATETSRA